jgi:type III pantothenate kinase
MKLLVDSGNTRLKWGWSDKGEITLTGALVNSQISFAVLLASWQVLPIPPAIVISCVNSPQVIALITSVADLLWPDSPVIVAQSALFQCGVRNAYELPETLGVDRWMALIAVRNFYCQAACIVDCGTAITIDFMDADGYHQGGMICPGLQLMKQSLSKATQQLPYSATDYAVGLANNTEAGIYNGTLFAACGLIEKVLARQSAPLQLILTGGDAKCIAALVSCECVVDDNLVLRGLGYISEAIATQFVING